MWIPLFTSYLVVCLVATPGDSARADFQSTLGHLKPRASSDDQAQAARDLIQRLVGDEQLQNFEIDVDPNIGPFEPNGRDTFKITKLAERRLKIVGTTGVAVAWGFNYVLKNFCNSHVAWEGSRVHLPAYYPDVDIQITSNDRFRYYQNVCTAGYSFVWWRWDEWERHIDWMALNGYNLVLAFHGQEAIWERIYWDMGLTDDEISFAGPAFLPWARMGNIRGWGGPLRPSWHKHTVALQKKILERMRQLGIISVLPAFAGHVPRGFTRIYPEANVTMIEPWNHFFDKYCCPYLLSPTDPLFNVIGAKFLKAYTDEFGTDHVYNCDTFNENEPQDSDLTGLKNIGSAVFAAMTKVDPDAIWLMQGWLFVHDFAFWTPPRVEAFVTSVPIGKMIVLDLQSEQFPQYTRLKSYYGQPFIWCMLHNFGGTLGMFGSSMIINERPFAARTMNGSTMIGTGLTPEGINQNYVIYDLMSEMAYRKKPVNLEKWFENYATRRYGIEQANATAAWRILGRTVYDFRSLRKMRGHYVITSLPTLRLKPWTWYDKQQLFVAWDNITAARDDLGSDEFYAHDLIDITRQALQLAADDFYLKMRAAFFKKNLDLFVSNAATFTELMLDLEEILASSYNFLLGTWLKNAKRLAVSTQERINYEFNARNQITLWGPRGEIRDYANKQWSGVMRDYFLERWKTFIDALTDDLRLVRRYNESRVHREIFFKTELPFTVDDKMYPEYPTGNCLEIAARLNEKWRNYWNKYV